MNSYSNIRRLYSIAIIIGLIIVVLEVKYGHVNLGFNYRTFGLVGIIGTITSIEWALFNKWLWRMSLLRGWLVYIPNLRGSWQGKIQSTYLDPATKKPIAPIDIRAKIFQTLTQITLDLSSVEMESKSIVSQLTCDLIRRDNELYYIYQSVPDANVRDRSAVHYGSANLRVKKVSGKTQLSGNYWTDRNTTGTISLHQK